MALTDYQRNIVALLARKRIFAHGNAPDAAGLSVKWKVMLTEARTVVSALPVREVGTCVLDASGNLFKGDVGQLEDAIARGAPRFHQGSIRGSIPRFVEG